MSEAKTTNPAWADLPDEALLNVRMSDLKLSLAGTYLEGLIQELYRELEERGLVFRPPCYLGDEWFTPDGVPAISIPFYLAHPRLKQLEQNMMLEVEGGAESDCLKLLRHEAGHALCHAFRLPRRPHWRQVFGQPSQEFKDFYHYQPYSKRFVRHLENWYAQSHPEEDFAETFAVWLTPGSDWRTVYQGWPAMKKLKFVDTLMQELKGQTPLVSGGEQACAARRLRRRLRTHYERRRKFYAEDDPSLFDSDLQRIFAGAGSPGHGQPASRFLRRQRVQVLEVVAFWTRERKFTVSRLLRKLAARCDELRLYLPADESRALLDIAAYLTALVANYLFTGKFKGRL